MELNGALSNPLASDKGGLARLAAVKQRALGRLPVTEGVRLTGRRQGAVLASVTTVLDCADQPLGVQEIHAAVEEFLGGPVPVSSIKQALSAHAGRGDGRFRRIRRGCHEPAVRR